MKKYFKKIIIFTLLTVTIIMQVPNKPTKAAENITNQYIDIKEDLSKIETDRTVDITVSIENMDTKLSYIDFYINYDKNIFQEVKASDITYNFDENLLSYFTYNTEKGKILTEFDDDITVNEVFRVKLKLLDTVDRIHTTNFEVNNLYCYSYIEDKEFRFDNAQKSLSQQEPEQPVQPLYLSTDSYKIGDNNTKIYENGDKYISRINANTVLNDFISKLSTNGEVVKVLKEDNTELANNEFVGTGMTLVVTKDEERIELKIAVMGDLSGEGKVTAQDLSTLNKSILQTLPTPLENEYKIAADLDENNNITATDLSTLLKMI